MKVYLLLYSSPNFVQRSKQKHIKSDRNIQRFHTEVYKCVLKQYMIATINYNKIS